MTALPSLASPTVLAVEEAVAAAATTRQSRRVSPSAIGKCQRHLWYRFRWAHEPEGFEPRMLRLFETGHLEEARMIAWLQGAGVTVEAVDPETGEQWAVEALGGHLFGYLDGIATGIVEAPKTAHLLECKTHNAKSFAQLQRVGVAIAKPEHVAQMQVYMHLKGLTRAFYLAKNKDTDELYAERVEYDPTDAGRLMLKAEQIVRTSTPPPKLTESADHFGCRFCPSRVVCHENGFENAMVPRNCRTCLHSTACEDGDGRWHCARHDIYHLTLEQQEQGCPNHLYLPGLVPGEQVDADAAGEWVEYRLADGSTWRDAGMVLEAAA